MRKIGLTITFSDDDGVMRSASQQFETPYSADLAGEQRITHNIFADLNVAVGQRAAPRHNETARKWLEFPNRPTRMTEYFDVRNTQALWVELANLVMGVEGDLMLSRAFKALEPQSERPFEDGVALDNLYFIHDRKLTLLNQAVHGLIKVQDLVNRLLHETLGGDLVDTSKTNWERTQLTRENLVKGLEAKRVTGAISQSDYDAIIEALKIAKNTPKGEIAKTYRNRLMHHVRPSVDYPMFFSPLESRVGEQIKNAQGQVIGSRHQLLARPPIEYKFNNLGEAFSEYLDALVAMLQKLSGITILRR